MGRFIKTLRDLEIANFKYTRFLYKNLIVEQINAICAIPKRRISFSAN